MQVLNVIGWLCLLSILKSLASLRMPSSVEQYFCYFYWSPVDYYFNGDTLILHLMLKYIYLYASAVHSYIVWFDYIVANYVTIIPHRAHRWNVWIPGCDRLVSEPTLSELNSSLLCLISVTQLHIPRFSSLDKELRKYSKFVLFSNFVLYIFCCVTCLIFDRFTKCRHVWEEEEGDKEHM